MRRRSIIALLAVLAAVALGVAACGGGDDEGSGTTDFLDTGIFGGETDFLPPTEDPPVEPPAATEPSPEIIQIAVPAAGEPIGPESPSERIAEVQRALLALGFKIGKADGVWGSKTRNALVRFQKNHKLEADGFVGPKTARAINRELRERAAG